MELGIDTSSSACSIALSHKGSILTELTWQSTQNHTVELLPNLLRLLDQAKAMLTSMEAIIVAMGPGSFNGLRVGVSTAKGLAFALSIPLLGISTLEVEAYSFAYTGLPLRPIHHVSHEKIATALYQQKDNGWYCLEKEHLSTVDALCRQTRRKTLFCGEISPDIIQLLKQRLGKQALIPPAPIRLRRAGFLNILAWEKLDEGQQDDPATLQPLYPCPPHITKPKRMKSSQLQVKRKG